MGGWAAGWKWRRAQQWLGDCGVWVAEQPKARGTAGAWPARKASRPDQWMFDVRNVHARER